MTAEDAAKMPARIRRNVEVIDVDAEPDLKKHRKMVTFNSLHQDSRAGQLHKLNIVTCDV